MRRYSSLTCIVLASTVWLTGCASKAYSVGGTHEIPGIIKLPNLRGEVAQFSDDFTDPFIARGFSFGESDDPRAAELVVRFNPNPFNTEFDVSLLQQGRVLLNSTASNKGWGTGLARSAALADLVSKVRSGIETSLSEMSFELIADKPVAQVICEDLFGRSELVSISEKVVLTSDRFANFQQLIDKSVPTDIELKALFFWADAQQACHQRVVANLTSAGQQMKKSSLFTAFNKRQALLAALVNSSITYGEFAKQNNDILATLKDDTSKRLQRSAAELEQEKKRAQNQTNQVQSQYQKSLSETLNRQQERNTQMYNSILQNQRRSTNCNSTIIGNTVNTNCY